jgi:hypothetical protein
MLALLSEHRPKKIMVIADEPDIAALVSHHLRPRAIRGRPLASEHVLSVAINPAIGPVLADPLKLSPVCANLLDNAL